MHLLFSRTTLKINPLFLTIIFLSVFFVTAFGPSVQPLLVNANNKGETKSITSAASLDKISVVNAKGKSIKVSDGKGNIYFSGVPGEADHQTVLFKSIKIENSTYVDFSIDPSTGKTPRDKVPINTFPL